MNSKKHAEVWSAVADALETHAQDYAGQSRRDIDLLVLFANEVAIAYAYQREADNAS